MGTRDRRVDAYIAGSAAFARPILEQLRAVVHAACPACAETMRWSFPHFDYKGEMLCSMAAFKQHAAFGFWKEALVLGPGTRNGEAMGSFGRITGLKDLPSKRELAGYVRKAMKLNDAGVKISRQTRRRKPALKVPAAFAAALEDSAILRRRWDAFPPSHRREYLEWFLGAKREATRERRLAQTIAQVRAGKSLNWKYERG